MSFPDLPPRLPPNDASAVPSSNQSEEWVRPETSSLFIRTVRTQDLLSLAEVLTSSFHSADGTWGWLYPLLRVGIYEDLKSRLQARKPHYACLVAVLRDTRSLLQTAGLGDRPIGTVELSLRHPPLNPFRKSRYLYLSNLAVSKEYRRQGVAQQLLQACERIALDWGFHELYLHVLEDNHAAKRLYYKAGYRVRSIELNPIAWALGKPRQLLLAKRLGEP